MAERRPDSSNWFRRGKVIGVLIVPSSRNGRIKHKVKDILERISVRLMHPMNGTYFHRFNSTHSEHITVSYDQKHSILNIIKRILIVTCGHI